MTSNTSDTKSSQTEPSTQDIPAYDAHAIEDKWQAFWDKNKTYQTDTDPAKTKKYVLEMFPYPSGDLHMGHARNYTIGDCIARHARMCGMDVLHPIGFDAFGLPAENAAIKHHTQASTWTYANIEQAKATMRKMGFSYDYERMFNTCDPSYYRWGQYMFIKMWEKGLAYRATSSVNWCSVCKTVLANEQVINGRCWRCHSVSTKRKLSQWYLRITKYAQELLDDLDTLDGWPENVLAQQRNWIGRSEGTEIDFLLAPKDLAEKLGASNAAGAAPDVVQVSAEELESLSRDAEKLSVFTTRADTIFGVSFMVLPPESELAQRLVAGSEYEAPYQALKEQTKDISSIEREGSDREKHGVFTGRYAINPVNGALVPIWVADYVLADYGTGLVMGVPCGDERDFQFARKYHLPIPPIICTPDDPLYAELSHEHELRVRSVDWEHALEAKGFLVQSGAFTGLEGGKHSPAEKAIRDYLAQKRLARARVQYRLRDWLISRQRYWGNPIPMISCPSCGDVPVPESDLPVLLPRELDLGSESSLADCKDFYETTCPRCHAKAKRITDTMDTFTCSSWYFLRYCDPHNDTAPFSQESVQRWMPVDNYIGGIEHAILHLLYSRFWVKVARDLGLLHFDEPFTNLLCQGMVRDENGDTMSKSKGNVVPPSSVIEPYGSDTLRLAILFIAPCEKDFNWDPDVVAGTNRFLKRSWRVIHELMFVGASHASTAQDASSHAADPSSQPSSTAADAELTRALHRLGYRCSEDFKRFQFNTAISAIMELINVASKCLQEHVGTISPDVAANYARACTLLLAPICPHFSEELWHKFFLDRDKEASSVYDAAWPSFDPSLAKSDDVELAVQVMGKIRAHITVSVNATKDEVEAKALDEVKGLLEGKEIRKVIVVPKRLVNIVCS